ncbi:MAG: phosphatase [Clostridiales bacterium]|nr:phosphatase [Clostridiales bacterium]
MKPLKLDLHTHTLASGHAYGTIQEMAKEAAEKQIEVLGITEHAKGIPGTCEDIYFANLKVVPRRINGVQLLLGSEINILDYEGHLSLKPKYMEQLDICIAGIHWQCYTFGSREENTRAVIGAIRNPFIDVISHPDDGNCPLYYEAVVAAAKEHHTLLEINNNSLRMSSRKDVLENDLTILRLCKEYGHPVLVSSDAHFPTDIGNTDEVEKVFARIDFPEELIINYNPQKLLDFLHWNREHRK